MSRTLLLEIGVEELPSSFVDAALAALPEIAAAKLAALRLAHGEIRALGTPRRLALLVPSVAERQPDLDEEVTGPPETAAFKDGKPTRAAEAFAEKIGVSVDALSIADKPASGRQKAGRYVIGRRKEAGRDARELLGRALTEICAQIPFRKSMRWGSGEATFGRPVQWLVALFGDDVVDTTFADVRSGRTTRGHRFLSPDAFDVATADGYLTAMRERHVLVDRDERARVMLERVEAAASAAGGTHDPEPYLVDENASLVEEPFVVTGSFDPKFLELPASVIRAVARGHQKYFCVHAPSGEGLLPRYLAVVNTANDPARIAKGMDRVMRARLADARFFFEEDKRASLAARVEKLAGIVFHNRLGTVREKVTRIERLVSLLGEPLRLDASARADAARAAHLCKFDLVSLMVGEFPELQGEMGAAYARFAGEPARVADAVRDHYCPIGADGPVAKDDVAAVVALADRLDSLVGCFAVGLSPTGAADPFALRRACIAVLRILLEKGKDSPAWASLRLGDLFTLAYDGFEDKKRDLDRDACVKKLLEFTEERLRGLLASATSTAVADAVCAAGRLEHPVWAMARASAVHAAVVEGRDWLAQARTVAKRLGGISKESAPVLHPRSAFTKEHDAEIVDLVGRVDQATRELTTEGSVTAALAQAEGLAKGLDGIFEKTLVNDPDDARTPQRLELLSFGASAMLRICDFSRLV